MVADAAAEGLSWWAANGNAVIAVSGTLLAALLGMVATLQVAKRAGESQKRALELQIAHQTAEGNRSVSRDAYADFIRLTETVHRFSLSLHSICAQTGETPLEHLRSAQSGVHALNPALRDALQKLQVTEQEYADARARLSIFASDELRDVAFQVYDQMSAGYLAAISGEDPKEAFGEEDLSDKLRGAMQRDLGLLQGDAG
jgi:hypothetical protein